MPNLKTKTIVLTQKLAITPTAEQRTVLWKLSDLCRQLYNHALADRKETWEQTNTSVSYVDQQNALKFIKEYFPEYKQVFSKVLQTTLRKLDRNYKSFFGLYKKGHTDARPPRFRGHKYFFTLNYNQKGFKITNNTIKFSHKHVSQIPLVFTIPAILDVSSVKVKQVELFHDRYDDQFYVAITYERPIPEYSDNGLYQAFDLGITKHTAVNSHGEFFESTVARPDKYWEPKTRSIQARRDHCKKNSRRWKVFNQRLRTIKRKSANQTKDWQHKQSKHFVENTQANTIIVGDLQVKDMTKGKKKIKSINRGVQNTGHLSRFVEFLTYKAQKIGKKTVVIDERGTSKTCYACGHQQPMPLFKREYLCECGNRIDRDCNSAINIMLRYLSRNALWTGYCSFVEQVERMSNLRHTAESKTKVSDYLLGLVPSEIVGLKDSQEAPCFS